MKGKEGAESGEDEAESGGARGEKRNALKKGQRVGGDWDK